MCAKRVSVFGISTSILLFSTLLQAAPVLIEVNLEDKADFGFAKGLGISAWARWGNIFLAETEEENLSSLQEKEIRFEVITRFPGTEKSYLLSPHPGIQPSKVADVIGRPVLNESEQFFAQLNQDGLAIMEENGYVALEIGEKAIPFTYQEPMAIEQPSAAVLDWIQTLVDQISRDSLQSYNQRLQNFQTRYSYSDSIASARQWLVDKFTSFGIDSVYLDHFFYDSDQWNVVATVPGTVEPDVLIVVGGHYDSVTYGQSPGPLTYAPGADDNGSGTAATLEIARIIADNPLPQTMLFVPFAQEEQGLKGSNAFADEALFKGWDIRFMLNMDMIGYKYNDTLVWLLHDPPSQPIADLMVNLALTYAGLTGVKSSASGNSDHWPFMQNGYQAVFTHEYIFNSQGWHKNTDVTDSMNFDYVTKVAKLALATITSLSQSSCANFVGDLNGNSGISLGDAVYLVNYLFGKPGNWPIDPACQGDVNGDSTLSLSDVIHLANFIFGKPGDWSPVPTGSCCLF
ncbi:MAG: hypothetical protein A2142_03110 [candidate division Zixibacteria bacterium RBG_16_48_11]|nr:MAG: hypothetical protein A2142_03110 [candidate division Zixibacteria bacterium RBG_16_48_11]